MKYSVITFYCLIILILLHLLYIFQIFCSLYPSCCLHHHPTIFNKNSKLEQSSRPVDCFIIDDRLDSGLVCLQGNYLLRNLRFDIKYTTIEH